MAGPVNPDARADATAASVAAMAAAAEVEPGLTYELADELADEPRPEPRRCPSCGASRRASAVVCIACGTRLDTGQKLRTDVESTDAEAAAPPPPPALPRPILIARTRRIALGLLVMAVGLPLALLTERLAPAGGRSGLLLPMLLVGLAACMTGARLAWLGARPRPDDARCPAVRALAGGVGAAALCVGVAATLANGLALTEAAAQGAVPLPAALRFLALALPLVAVGLELTSRALHARP